MKKTLLSIAFTLMGVTSIFAAKAYPGPITVTQSDGTELTVYLHGDENFNWMTTEDGALIKQVGKSYYIAETTNTGLLKATKYLAHNATSRIASEAKAIKKQDKQLFFNAATEKAASSKALKSMGTGNYGVKYFPHTGSPKALVILAEFSDVKFVSGQKAKNVFEHFLKANGDESLPDGYDSYTGSYKYRSCRNYGCVSEYFQDMSKGSFTPQFDVVGPYTLNNTSAYYGKGENDNGPQLVADACAQAYADGVDFSQYDADGDGDVDLVYIIYAGYPASMTSNVNDIWPKAMYNTKAFCSYNGKNIRRSGIHAERNFDEDTNKKRGYLLSGIGLFCHEFSHTMGLPDLYPDGYHLDARVDNQEPEMWDLMDGGEYTYNGYCPSPYSPWEMDAMGWNSPIKLEDKEQQVTLNSYHQDRTAYKINGENNEYLLLQNIQKEGWWSGLCKTYNHGMLIWRIDYDNQDVNTFDYPNNTKGKPKVTIVPADGYIISSYQVKDEDNPNLPWSQDQYTESLQGDPFPGTQNVTQLLSVTLNNSTLEKPIYNIKEENGVITFDYLKDFTTGIDSPITNTDTEKDARIYTLDGRYIGTDASQLTKGVYIIGKKKVVIK